MSEHLQSGLHPDPDSLNAFIEGVLPEHERIECLAHLAECAQCREVVYLAQDPVAAEPLPAPRPKRWFAPIWALSVAAVAGILVLSVALYQFEKPAATAPVAMVSVPSSPAAKQLQADAPVAAAPLKRAAKRPMQHPEPLAAPPPPAPLPAQRAADDAMQINGSVSSPVAPSGVAGTITDPAGGVIPGATVTVHPSDAANSFVANTDPTGQFQINGLPPGRYELKAAAPGFQSATKQVEVKADQVARADSALSVGSVSQTVEVTASSAALNTESASMSVALKKKSTLAAIPLVGRITQSKAMETAVLSLPSKLAAVATVTKDKVTLAADSAGSLFLSQNSGQKWKAVKSGLAR